MEDMKGTRRWLIEPARYRAEGEPSPENRDAYLDFPIAPDVDFSWHRYAECDGDEEAANAIEQIHRVGGPRSRDPNPRPWEAWCSVCPVRAHCLEQGFTEDEAFPSRTIGRKGKRRQVKFAPFIYGGLTPAERRSLSPIEKTRHAKRLKQERDWLKTLIKRVRPA